jgi:hypothetical protein
MRRQLKSAKFWKPVAAFFILTPFLLFFGVISAAGGHGSYFFLKVLLPFAILSSSLFDSTIFSDLLAIVQFPIYGIVFGLANLKNQLDVSVAAVLVAHLLAIFTCFLFFT